MNSRPIKVLAAQILTVAAGVLLFTGSPPPVNWALPGQKVIEQSIQNAYKGKTLSLRSFYVSPALEFDSKGGVVGDREVGPWTLYSRILVDDIKLKSQALEIHGHRLFLHYLPQEKKFRELHDGEVRIRADLDHEPSSAQGLEPLLAKIFVMPGEDFSPLVPPYWREFCSHMNDPDWSQKQLEKAVAESRARDKAETWPVPIYKPEPTLTREAHDAKINGTVVLSIGIDEYGHVSDVMVITPLGMGLDESAVETVRIWRFKPAQLNRNAKPVKIVAEFSFRVF